MDLLCGTENDEKTTALNDDDFDDDLGVPHTLTVISVEGSPVVIDEGASALVDEGNDHFDFPPVSPKIPFSACHEPPKKFKSHHRNIFIPEVDINVTIVDRERNLTTHLLNPNLYTISLKHGDFTWQITKRYSHIHYLHQQLVLFKTSLNIPFPSKTHKEKRESIKKTGRKKQGRKRRGSLPRFPKKPEVLVPFEQLDRRTKQLEEYLNNLLSINIYRNHPETIEFLEVSHLSFIHDLGIKGKEGLVKKRTGNTHGGCNCFGLMRGTFCIRCRYFCNDVLWTSWNERWFFVKDTCCGYINPKNGRLCCVILFDQGFEVSSGMYSTGLHKSLQIVTLSRQILIKLSTRRSSKEWLQHLREVSHNQAKDFIQPNRYHSFAPIRNNVTACWFVDGSGYMAAVADAIENAKEEVFIVDWWLSPEIHLKRPALDGDYWRLDVLLKRKAQEGVKIFILLYKEVEMALGLNSYYSKQRLMSNCHDNIKVMRHPDHAKVGVFLWAHHEKIVAVDQTFAFLGGLDLCYGRWDDAEHRLTDLGSMTPTVDVSTLKKRTSSTPSGDHIYPIPKPVAAICKPSTPILRDREPNSPNCSAPFCLNPEDNLLMLSRRKRNDSESETKKNMFSTLKDKARTKSRDFIKLMYGPNEESVEKETGEDQCDGMVDSTDIVSELDGSAKYWIGKDYVNFIVKDFNNLDAPFDDFIDRGTTPRMPWHDVGVCVQGAAAQDVARHFIQRWNACKLEKTKLNKAYPYLLPKSYSAARVVSSFPNFLSNHKVTCQVLRSSGTWSVGFLEPNTVEQSIHEAYVDVITRAQHYIYIENQFFISLAQSNLNTKNQVGETLFLRIVRAHKENAVFRVYVVMPLLPGFEGEIGAPSGTSLHAISHWNYQSICCGNDSIVSRLTRAGINPGDYINFYGLRNYSELNGEPITELIYVHSKLLIADDKIMICGSANINDRSLIGKRDSEIAVIIEDETFDDGLMNNKHFPCGKLVGSLRKRLFKEHLGLLGNKFEQYIDVTDPISDHFYKQQWHETARLNTHFYEQIFHCIPSDRVDSFATLKKYQEEKPLYVTEISQAEKMLESIQGHLVLLPLNFLSKEVLTPTAGTVEGIMPQSLWT